MVISETLCVSTGQGFVLSVDTVQSMRPTPSGARTGATTANQEFCPLRGGGRTTNETR